MKPVMLQRSTTDWITLFEDKAVPCGPINTIAEAFEDPQVKARGIRKTLPRNAGDGISSIATVANPMRLSNTPVTYRYAPPTLGQHTDEVLREFGLDANTIANLHQQGVV